MDVCMCVWYLATVLVSFLFSNQCALFSSFVVSRDLPFPFVFLLSLRAASHTKIPLRICHKKQKCYFLDMLPCYTKLYISIKWTCLHQVTQRYMFILPRHSCINDLSFWLNRIPVSEHKLKGSCLFVWHNPELELKKTHKKIKNRYR